MTGTAPVAGIVVATFALLAGYLVGSIPTIAVVARSAGIDLAGGEGNPGSATVWHEAGPGWGFLALTLDLAKGVIPVAVGIVTVSWGIGWVAGLGAVLGAGWPAFGRRRGGRAVATFSGVAFTLAPPAGTVSVLLTLLVVAAGRVVGRNARVAAIAAGIGSYPAFFLAVQQDVTRLLALLVLYLIAVVRFTVTRDRP